MGKRKKKKKAAPAWKPPKEWVGHLTIKLPKAVKTHEELADATISLDAAPETAGIGKSLANLLKLYPDSPISEAEMFNTCECPWYVVYLHNPGTCESTRYVVGPCGPECNCP